MPELKSFFRTLEEKSPRNVANIAGYIDDRKTFQFYVSQSENLPAAAVVFDLISRNKMTGGKVYTNLRKSHWIYTYTSGAEGEGGNDLVFIDDANAAAGDMGPLTRGNGKVRVLAGDGPSPGPLRGGGLYQAAKSLHDSKAPVSYRESDDHSRDKGLHRALRYYMLAAYALLGKSAEERYSEGNYIAGLMVDDEGRILSYGVNSGWFHHGETNMLLHYFSEHAGQPKFPANTIIFSTLTPCKQCSKYIEATRPADSVIFIGQEDTGGRGREGEKFGVHLSAVTDPIRNRVAKPVMEDRDTGKVRTIPGAWGKPPTTVPIIERVQVAEKVEKPILETLLAERMREGATIAEQIGKHCGELLVQSRATFTHKHAKVRDQGLDDQLVKYQVLDYLNTWMKGVGTQSYLKQIG